MAQKIHLNGGPWHDQVVAIPDGRDHFHIIVPSPPSLEEFSIQETVSTREGTYSQVRRVAGEFEWDGWRSHD